MSQKISSTELQKRAFLEQSKDIFTSIPGHVLAFDTGTQLAQIQLGVQRRNNDGTSEDIDPLIEVPVQFPGGNNYLIEIEVNPGDEGMIFFSQRCISAWINEGGVAENPILRFHDMNDAYFVPGLRSQPNAISDFSNNGIKMRNKAGDKYFWLKNDGTAAMKVTSLEVEGDINATGDVKAGSISLTSHTHGFDYIGAGTASSAQTGDTDAPS